MNRDRDLPRHEMPVDIDASQASRYNPPGQASLAYRAGTYATFLQRMLDTVHRATIPSGPNRGKQPLRNLNTSAERDWVVGLFKAWALVGDVLTFYQERIANEGFPRTATENRSVRELVRAIDYHPRPGVSASTYLAFTLLNAPGAPDRLTVPAGTAVQSVPNAGMMPVTFETSAAIEARPEWNALAAYTPRLSVPPEIGFGATELRISGVRPGLQPGTSLLIVGDPVGGQTAGPTSFVRIIQKVDAGHADGTTRLIWNEPLDCHAPLVNPTAYLLRQQATLFGHDAPAWQDLPATTKEKYAPRLGGLLRSSDGGATWQPANQGLPEATVQALVVDNRGRLFAGTSAGVFRSTDDGQSWQSASPSPLKKDVLCLAIDRDGYLLVGTDSGEVFRSADAGATWNALRGGVQLDKGGLRWQPINARFPKTVVRALVAEGSSERSYLFAGTDKGIVRSADSGSSWQPANLGLPGRDSGSGLAPVIVHALAVDTSGVIFAGTDHGIYVSNDRGDNWRAANNGLPESREQSPSWLRRTPRPPSSQDAVVYALAAYVDPRNQSRHLLAATDRGVFASADQGGRWTPANGGIPSEATVRALAVVSGSSSTSTVVFAGTDAGVFRSDDHGTTWSRVVEGDVQALAVGPNRRVYAATPLGGFAETEWPHFGLAGTTVDLDRTYAQVVKGGWVVLQQSKPAPLVSVFPVLDVTTITRADFSLKATVSRVDTGADPRLAQFSLRDTTALISTDSLELATTSTAPLDPIEGTTLNLDGVVASLETGREIAIVGKRTRARLVGDLGGVFQANGTALQSIGLLGLTVRAVALDSQAVLLAGTDAGVFRYAAASWQSLGLNDQSIAALAVEPDGGVLAGTADGVFRYAGTSWESAGMTGETVQAFALDSHGSPAVGTPAGMTRLGAGAPSTAGLSGKDVRCLFVDPQSRLYAGTGEGVFREQGTSWESVGGLAREVFGLAADGGGNLVAGTPDGVFRFDGTTWNSLGLPGRLVTALVGDTGGNLYAGTRGGGIWRWSPGQATWSLLPIGASNDVRAMAVDHGGALFVGTGPAAILTSLDGLTQLPWARERLFGMAPARQNDLDAGVISDAARADFAAQKISLAKNASLVVVTRGQCWLLRDDQDVDYLIRKGSGDLGVFASQPLTVLGAPRADVGQTSPRTWALQNRDGWQGTLTASTDDIFQDRAGPADPSVAEIGQILATRVSANQEYTALTLASPLGESFDPATTTVNANLAPATHGETVPQEVLGSGNASLANQCFTLKKPPLTFVPAATSSGSADTLTIRVQSGASRPLVPIPGLVEPALPSDGILWHEVPSLYNAGPRDRVYMVQVDDEGRASVTFGDGERGARLPSGVENVVAAYRSGLGPDGNLDANRLTTLKSRPPGVRRVTNPIPATGGEAPESIDRVRYRAPLTIRTFGRIVSLQDYEDFVRTFAGVSKALVRVLSNDGDQLIQVTFATEDGQQLDPASLLYASLVQAVEANRVPGPPVRLDSYEPVFFNLAATIVVEPDHLAAPVLAAIADTLTTTFSFARRDLAQDLAASDVVSVIQGVDGVTAVRLDALYPVGFQRAVNPILTAAPARWEHGRVAPAQLLLLNTANGLQLKAENGS